MLLKMTRLASDFEKQFCQTVTCICTRPVMYTLSSSVDHVIHFLSNEELDHANGWITIVWEDATCIQRNLNIDSDGFCSREMPVRSGRGLIDFAMKTDHLKLTFAHDLANQLELEPEVEVRWKSLPCGREHLEEFLDHLAIDPSSPKSAEQGGAGQPATRLESK